MYVYISNALAGFGEIGKDFRHFATTYLTKITLSKRVLDWNICENIVLQRPQGFTATNYSLKPLSKGN